MDAGLGSDSDLDLDLMLDETEESKKMLND